MINICIGWVFPVKFQFQVIFSKPTPSKRWAGGGPESSKTPGEGLSRETVTKTKHRHAPCFAKGEYCKIFEMKLWSMHHSIVLRGGSLTGRWLGDRRYLVAVRKPGRSIAWRSARSRLSQHLLQSICQGCTSPPCGPVLHFETMARTRGRYQQKLKVATSNDIFQKRQNAKALHPVLSITCVSQKPNKNGNHKKKHNCWRAESVYTTDLLHSQKRADMHS